MLQELSSERFRTLQARANQSLFSDDPFIAHDPRNRGAESIENSKRIAHQEMSALSAQFEGISLALVQTAADLAIDCHFNHFRDGPGDIHYSVHLLETANRVNLHFNPESIGGLFQVIATESGELLDKKAIVIAIALLHDSLEDFHENFRNKTEINISVEEGRDAVVLRLQNHLGAQVGNLAATQIISRIKALSIDNKDEFPSSDFLKSAFEDGYTRIVILADKDHNLTTLPSFLPSYSAFVVPAQFGVAVENTPFATSYANSVIRSCLELDRRLDLRNDDSILQDSTFSEVSAWIELVCEYEGSPGVFRANQYYDKLLIRLEAGEFDPLLTEDSVTRDLAIAAISKARTYLPAESSPIPMEFANFPVTSQRVQPVFAKQLGPIEFWGVDISISGSRDDLKEVINEVVLRTGKRITGYFTQSPSGTTFHISRLPRSRVGLSVDSIETYESALTEFEAGLKHNQLSPQVYRATQANQPEVQSLFGLEEGYYENRRRELIEYMPETIGDMQALLQELEERFGDLSRFHCENPYDSRCSFAITHTLEEIDRFLAGGDFTATPAEIFAAGPKSYDPTKLSIYSEPAVFVAGKLPALEPIPRALVTIASELGQARFSVEYPRAKTATNVEIVGLSEGASAQRA